MAQILLRISLGKTTELPLTVNIVSATYAGRNQTMKNSKRNYRVVVAILTFLFFSVINPAYFVGCANLTDEEPNFGETEMLEVLSNVQRQTVWNYTGFDGSTYEIELSVEQATEHPTALHRNTYQVSFFNTAFACVDRSFFKSASACIDSTEVPLEGKMTVRKSTYDGNIETLLQDQDVEGSLVAEGLTLGTVDLYVSYSNGYVGFISSDGVSFKVRSIAID